MKRPTHEERIAAERESVARSEETWRPTRLSRKAELMHSEMQVSAEDEAEDARREERRAQWRIGWVIAAVVLALVALGVVETPGQQAERERTLEGIDRDVDRARRDTRAIERQAECEIRNIDLGIDRDCSRLGPP